jgi:hypothetical protein
MTPRCFSASTEARCFSAPGKAWVRRKRCRRTRNPHKGPERATEPVRQRLRELRMSGSVAALGEKSPGATRRRSCGAAWPSVPSRLRMPPATRAIQDATATAGGRETQHYPPGSGGATTGCEHTPSGIDDALKPEMQPARP